MLTRPLSDSLCFHMAIDHQSEVSCLHQFQNFTVSIMIIARQEKLLQGLMTEIVRMTSQMRPLEMGIPLYPFSHSGIFPIPQYTSNDTTGAPLPDASTFEEQTSSPGSLRGMASSPPIVGMAIPVPPPSVSPRVPGEVLGWRPHSSRSPASIGPNGILQASHMAYPHQ
jgi:hypothetical protein